MTIRDEVPGLANLMVQLEIAMDHSADGRSNEIDKLHEAIDKAIATHKLPKDVQLELQAAVEHDIGDYRVRKVKIYQFLFRPDPTSCPTEWFSRWESLRAGMLDGSVFYEVYHPALFGFARDKWQHNSRVQTIALPDTPSSLSNDYSITEALDVNGIPRGKHPGHWAVRALDVAGETLTALGFDFRLCDIVEWTCSQDPLSGSANADAEFREARFVDRSEFGARISIPDDHARLERSVIWRRPDGAYLSPMWEYLQCQRGAVAGFDAEANCLGAIGQGIDAAVLARTPAVEPVDAHRVHAAASFIFEAGEALTRLRFQMELKDTIVTGFKAERSNQQRISKSIATTQARRDKRIEHLLTHIERIFAANPLTRTMRPEQVAEFAVAEAAKEDPDLWARGVPQAEEYLGRIRRGEAGPELQERYLVMFPARPGTPSR